MPGLGPGLGPGIHEFALASLGTDDADPQGSCNFGAAWVDNSWMPGPRPGMTIGGRYGSRILNRSAVCLTLACRVSVRRRPRFRIPEAQITPSVPGTTCAGTPVSAPGAKEAVAGHVHPVELPVAVLEVERDGGRRRGRGAADLGDLELDAVGQVDAHPVRGAGHRAGDRPAGGGQDAGDGDAGGALVDVGLEGDGLEERRGGPARHGLKEPPKRCPPPGPAPPPGGGPARRVPPPPPRLPAPLTLLPSP